MLSIKSDIKTFEKIERILEDFVLATIIKTNRKEDRMEVKEAKAFYATHLKKSSSHL